MQSSNIATLLIWVLNVYLPSFLHPLWEPQQLLLLAPQKLVQGLILLLMVPLQQQAQQLPLSLALPP